MKRDVQGVFSVQGMNDEQFTRGYSGFLPLYRALQIDPEHPEHPEHRLKSAGNVRGPMFRVIRANAEHPEQRRTYQQVRHGDETPARRVAPTLITVFTAQPCPTSRITRRTSPHDAAEGSLRSRHRRAISARLPLDLRGQNEASRQLVGGASRIRESLQWVRRPCDHLRWKYQRSNDRPTPA